MSSPSHDGISSVPIGVLVPTSLTLCSQRHLTAQTAAQLRSARSSRAAEFVDQVFGIAYPASMPMKGHSMSTTRLVIWSAVPSIGLLLGCTYPANSHLPAPYDTISSLIGWTYFAAWSVSFYPQVILNFRRNSVVGLSLDFTAFNLLGFLCYAVYNTAFSCSPFIQRKYAESLGGSGSDSSEQVVVDSNDVFFALHALALCTVAAAQCLAYERGGQRLSSTCKVTCSGVLALAGGVAAAKWLLPALEEWLTWLTYLYCLSYVKMAITLFKYVPQVVLNHNRRCTDGFIIDNVLLDFAGGALSTTQMLIDAGASGDWSPIIGNPVKLGLGMVSISFDVVFMLQHYVLYRKAGYSGFGERHGVSHHSHRYIRLSDEDVEGVGADSGGEGRCEVQP